MAGRLSSPHVARYACCLDVPQPRANAACQQTEKPPRTHLEHVYLLQRHLAAPGAVQAAGLARAAGAALHAGHAHVLRGAGKQGLRERGLTGC